MISYNADFSACEKCKRRSEAWAILTEMRHHGMQFCGVTYVMGCSFAHGRATLGIRDLGGEPDVISYNAAISAGNLGSGVQMHGVC